MSAVLVIWGVEVEGSLVLLAMGQEKLGFFLVKEVGLLELKAGVIDVEEESEYSLEFWICL